MSDIVAPLQGKYTSHYIRIVAHTEKVLSGIPLQARLAGFGWGADSPSMAALDFDRTVHPTGASY